MGPFVYIPIKHNWNPAFALGGAPLPHCFLMKKCDDGVNRFYVAKTILGGGLAGAGTGGSDGNPTPARYFFIEMPPVMAATI
jgi:hypothetical protein